MKKKSIVAVMLGLFFAGGIYLASCKREPVFIGSLDPVDPGDTITNPIDTTPPPPPPIDSVDLTGTPCSADSAYFQNQVLPILISQCALSGCHDVASHKENVILTNYQYALTTGKIKVFNASGSKLYQMLNDPDPNDRMPPAPAASLSAAQKALIFKWINQGALDNACNENYGQGCDTTGVTYSNFVQPLVANYCLGCHSNNATGGNLLLKTYDQVKASAASGKFHQSVAWINNAKPMPKNGQQLSQCFIDKVKAWVDGGMPQ